MVRVGGYRIKNVAEISRKKEVVVYFQKKKR